ncbi:MAG: amidohydrolase family protein [Candidatus Ratteibacteria bacterium]
MGDFRRISPENFIPVLQRHPDTKFDIYHCGYPYVREALNLGKEFSNVYLNFAWTHIISQKFAIEALDECLDLIPINKIIGFGGDYNLPVEKVYGHLFMAKEDIITVLEKKIKEKKIKFKESEKIIKTFFSIILINFIIYLTENKIYLFQISFSNFLKKSLA